MFKDKVYDNMDDVSKMFEPFQYGLNDDLAQFPDEIEITPKHLLSDDKWVGGVGADVHSVIHSEASKLGLKNMLESSYQLINHSFFEFKIDKEFEEEEVELDAKNMTLSHKIFLIKSKIAYDEQELEQMRKSNFENHMFRNFSRNSDLNKQRFNEIADLYGARDVLPDRSYHGKVTKFIQHLTKLIDEKVLDIRDMDLCNKFNDWIVLYVRHGNLAALNNLTRVKIITHQKRPIYSIEEKETK